MLIIQNSEILIIVVNCMCCGSFSSAHKNHKNLIMCYFCARTSLNASFDGHAPFPCGYLSSKNSWVGPQVVSVNRSTDHADEILVTIKLILSSFSERLIGDAVCVDDVTADAVVPSILTFDFTSNKIS